MEVSFERTVTVPKRAMIKTSDAPAGFNAFWEAYPRKVAKLEALRAWYDINPPADVQAQMLASLAWQVEQPCWKKDGGQFVPYPASWLRAGRWEDEPPSRQSIWQCPHTPHCTGRWACQRLQDIAAMKAGA